MSILVRPSFFIFFLVHSSYRHLISLCFFLFYLFFYCLLALSTRGSDECFSLSLLLFILFFYFFLVLRPIETQVHSASFYLIFSHFCLGSFFFAFLLGPLIPLL